MPERPLSMKQFATSNLENGKPLLAGLHAHDGVFAGTRSTG
jgi:hypothetical protein